MFDPAIPPHRTRSPIALSTWAVLLALAGCETAPTSPPPVVAASAPVPPSPGLTRIIGKSPEAVVALLGKPSLDRSEGPGRQLQFIRQPCVLDVFFYPAASTGAPAVRTAGARRPDGSRLDAGACLGLIAPLK